MTRSTRRTELAPGYLLHHRPWRDTSRILEVFTREHGRLTLFARGVRGPGASSPRSCSRSSRCCFPGWARGEAAAADLGRARRVAPGAAARGPLMPAFYLNELLLKLTTRHDPLPELFDQYHAALARAARAAAAGAAAAPVREAPAGDPGVRAGAGPARRLPASPISAGRTTCSASPRAWCASARGACGGTGRAVAAGPGREAPRGGAHARGRAPPAQGRPRRIASRAGRLHTRAVARSMLRQAAS